MYNNVSLDLYNVWLNVELGMKPCRYSSSGNEHFFSQNNVTQNLKILFLIFQCCFSMKNIGLGDQILLTLFIILVGLTVTLFSEKMLISSTYMVSCPT